MLTDNSFRKKFNFADKFAKDQFVLGLDISGRNCGLFLIPLSGDPSLSYGITLDLGGSNTLFHTNEDALYNLFSGIISFCSGKDVVLASIEDHCYSGFHIARGAERVGVAKLVATRFLRQSIPLITVAPKTLKKFILGLGKGRDKLPIQEAFSSLGYSISSEHEADSGVLAYIGMCYRRNNKCLNGIQREIIQTLRGKFPT